MPNGSHPDPRLAEGLDPELVAFVDDITAAYARFPSFHALDIETRRRVAEAVRAPWARGGPVLYRSVNRVISHMRARIHMPAPGPLPALIYLHGGGWTFFSLDTHDRLMREYAARAGIAVIGLEYPLAPETKFPNQLTLLADLVRLLANRGEDWGIDPSRLAIGGDSAGANLALATALTLRESDYGDALCGLLLNYGAFDARMDSESHRLFGDGRYLLGAQEMEVLWSNYTRDPSQRTDPFVSPILADLKGLPPSFMTIADLDILRDENLTLKSALEAANVPVSGGLYPGSIHAFLEAVSVSALADKALDDGAAWLRERLGISS
ncbi:alpha/beta hydrolase fold domain-containing protein [Pelagibacterium halotolerans]|uniref:Putative acetyl esterase n=1 Tax=Pelagibacterium halotolerans (strain DSM 22347 / JCM 15775 / CGMCC 1.7692 / B2) TaxID=1082931 RepID=G4R7L7_PELHB|nr:alpha/beta hydrolase fold domain-containing protein [Pelagibacterium halotolerans]AEQ52318.1 putative acetyl esterase [Pelagibacterium halotolerans B2]QJR17939.1 alpha/beta hydrolase fold domain-containing protein [Pelagibacterium halotolerans]SEA33127.1 acetyl esterase [Pelagibacterium halotolerans]